MFRTWMTVAIAAFVLPAGGAWAQDPAEGLWRTIDDATGKPRSLVRISENNGVLSGRVVKLFREPGEDPNPICEKCENSRRNQPVLGLTILTDMRREGREYTGGEILDPSNGKVYKARMALSENGSKLDVRGYIGMPMLGRTQTWERVQEQ
ncbi:MAG TPA: DUF2147 domain-containing protein [Noviherbaspirillum sp.]|nr:DUF2147 domain-containing protein [Noviherbaspirillum sp.]